MWVRMTANWNHMFSLYSTLWCLESLVRTLIWLTCFILGKSFQKLKNIKQFAILSSVSRILITSSFCCSSTPTWESVKVAWSFNAPRTSASALSLAHFWQVHNYSPCNLVESIVNNYKATTNNLFCMSVGFAKNLKLAV